MDQWTDKVRAGRCYTEDFCVMDSGCPFLRSCIRAREDTGPMTAVAEADPIDLLLADIFGTDRLGPLRRLWVYLRSAFR